MDNIDGNLMALELHEKQIEEAEKRYEEMMEEVNDTLGVDLSDLWDKTTAIIQKHNIEISVGDVWKEII